MAAADGRAHGMTCIAGTHRLKAWLSKLTAVGVSQQVAKFRPNGDCIRCSSTDIVDLSGSGVDVVDNHRQSVYEIVYVQEISDLLAVAINGECLAQRGRDRKPGNPALVLNAKLPLAINTRLTEDHCLQPINACIIAHILVGGAFGTPVG